jgi:hypothetical protein
MNIVGFPPKPEHCLISTVGAGGSSGTICGELQDIIAGRGCDNLDILTLNRSIVISTFGNILPEIRHFL